MENTAKSSIYSDESIANMEKSIGTDIKSIISYLSINTNSNLRITKSIDEISEIVKSKISFREIIKHLKENKVILEDESDKKTIYLNDKYVNIAPLSRKEIRLTHEKFGYACFLCDRYLAHDRRKLCVARFLINKKIEYVSSCKSCACKQTGTNNTSIVIKNKELCDIIGNIFKCAPVDKTKLSTGPTCARPVDNSTNSESTHYNKYIYINNINNKYIYTNQKNTKNTTGNENYQKHKSGVNMRVKTGGVIKQIFDEWKSVMNKPSAVLDKHRVEVISKALQSGFIYNQLITAIHGCAKSDWHMGSNNQGQKFNSISTIFKNAETIERFIDMEINPVKKQTKLSTLAENNINAAMDWLQERQYKRKSTLSGDDFDKRADWYM